jgi:hypothetical protein
MTPKQILAEKYLRKQLRIGKNLANSPAAVQDKYQIGMEVILRAKPSLTAGSMKSFGYRRALMEFRKDMVVGMTYAAEGTRLTEAPIDSLPKLTSANYLDNAWYSSDEDEAHPVPQDYPDLSSPEDVLIDTIDTKNYWAKIAKQLNASEQRLLGMLLQEYDLREISSELGVSIKDAEYLVEQLRLEISSLS